MNVIAFPLRRAIMSHIAHVVMPRMSSWVAAEFRNGGSHMSEHCSDCVISRTLNGTITSWNCAAEKLYGYSSAEVLGRPFKMLVPKDKHADLAAMDARLAQGEQIYAHAAVRLTKAGKRIGVTVAMSPIIDDEGVVVGAHGIGRPIAQQQEKKTLAEIKDSFAYGYFMAQLENVYAASENVVKLAANFPDAAQYFVQQVRSGMLEAPSGQPQILGITSLLCDLASEAADEQREGPGTGARAAQ